MTRPTQLGALPDATGTTFTVVSRHADAVELCLFDRADAAVEAARHRLRPSRRRGERNVWWLRLDGVGPGALYGYRVHGPFAPQDGHVFNPSKLLIDPWARAVTGRPKLPRLDAPYESGLWAMRAGADHGVGDAGSDVYDSTDSAAVMPKCVVVDTVTGGRGFDWQDVGKPETPWRDTYVYEAHVKGLTRLHPDVPPELRGTYLGLAQEPVLAHLRSLGVTAVELMPTFQSAAEDHLLRQGRENYWGYSTVSFFAPEAEYACDPLGGQADELRTMVRELHRAGLEVILDVVYNHTAEGGRRGPTYSLKGLDQALFYRLRPHNRREHVDFTGCGNTLDTSEPEVQRLILDSLRYWVEEMGVDGFRFDLAPVLGRNRRGTFDRHARLFELMALDPVFRGVKWIAEPWDVPPRGAPSGYRLGAFPDGWAEWNDRFRDAARRVWRGDASGPACADLATRLAGSSDVFGDRAPLASVNFVAAHDGFTLADLSSYERKHNEANGELNRDGTDHNLSRNWGIEGPADDRDGDVLALRALRALHRRNLLTTLLLARGVPMLGHGDELGRSQRGNNNAYCLDDETTWVDWSAVDESMLVWARRLGEIRRRFPQLRSSDVDPTWWTASGEAMAPDDWRRAEFVTFGMGHQPADGAEGLLLLVHGGEDAVSFVLPAGMASTRTLLDSARPDRAEDAAPSTRRAYELRPRSQALLAWTAAGHKGDPLP